ncbi:MAG: restriction endonuclease [Bacteroidetes bacterium]|nr:restriction endonuclease [Bacteroidota bacterium]
MSEEQFHTLRKYCGDGIPYFSLINNGVKFNEHVGVIQVGRTVIEVLPKADKEDKDESKWRNILIGMLKAVGGFEIKTTSESSLKLKSNTILDFYFEMFIKEIEYILHIGLVKKYNKTEGNVAALKGSLQFGKHIQQNLAHQERFYVRYTTYDVKHILHYIIYKTILLLKQINTNNALQSRIGALLLNFPEMPDIKVTEATFNRIVYNRKTEVYKKAIGISKLLLLKYHPDVSKGRNHVLALMFDMNKLWEQFVYITLRQHREFSVTAQTSKDFWETEHGRKSKIRPDIWIKKGGENMILDTKWKNLNGYNPTSDDLRQMYVYHEFYGAKQVGLVYPGSTAYSQKGSFYPTAYYNQMDKECSLIFIDVPIKTEQQNIIKDWQQQIIVQFSDWYDASKK